MYTPENLTWILIPQNDGLENFTGITPDSWCYIAWSLGWTYSRGCGVSQDFFLAEETVRGGTLKRLVSSKCSLMRMTFVCIVNINFHIECWWKGRNDPFYLCPISAKGCRGGLQWHRPYSAPMVWKRWFPLNMAISGIYVNFFGGDKFFLKCLCILKMLSILGWALWKAKTWKPGMFNKHSIYLHIYPMYKMAFFPHVYIKRHYMKPTQPTHHYRGNPSTLPYFCSFSPTHLKKYLSSNWIISPGGGVWTWKMYETTS